MPLAEQQHGNVQAAWQPERDVWTVGRRKINAGFRAGEVRQPEQHGLQPHGKWKSPETIVVRVGHAGFIGQSRRKDRRIGKARREQGGIACANGRASAAAEFESAVEFFLSGFGLSGCYKLPMTTDGELLQRYAETRSEDAFAELVRRYLNLVYSAAHRRKHSS